MFFAFLTAELFKILVPPYRVTRKKKTKKNRPSTRKKRVPREKCLVSARLACGLAPHKKLSKKEKNTTEGT